MKAIFGRFKHFIKRGITVPFGKFKILIKVETIRNRDQESLLELSHARYLEIQFPELKNRFGFELKRSNIGDVLKFYLEYLPLINVPSREAHLRTLLQRMKNSLLSQNSADPDLSKAVTEAIAYSDLKEGLPDRAKCLRSHPKYQAEWESETRTIEAAYGACYISKEWPNADRGAAIQFYFESHQELLRGKKIMHFAPEATLRKWFKSNYEKLGLQSYHTVDGLLQDVDTRFDIVDIKLPSESFDLIICHRVLEHIPDDSKGLKELHRLLTPEGFMNFSVPQMLHREETAEWVIPDESHHWHVRQYGADLEARLSASGFRVQLEPWLMKRERGELLEIHGFPLRMYNCFKN